MNCLVTRFVLWLVCLAVFPLPINFWGRSFQIEVLERITLAAPAARECAEPPCVETDLADRVLAYLEQEEKREIDPWLRDDIRIAWITTRWSQHGVPDWSWHRHSSPYVAATYQVLRCHPDEVWPRIEAQRKAKLGAMYEQVWGEASSPKKPVQSERRGQSREAAA
jgi:hypothetical protein